LLKALKEKTQSSIAIGFQLLASGKSDAFISAGKEMVEGCAIKVKLILGLHETIF